jgi:hypothetical protein
MLLGFAHHTPGDPSDDSEDLSCSNCKIFLLASNYLAVVVLDGGINGSAVRPPSTALTFSRNVTSTGLAHILGQL